MRTVLLVLTLSSLYALVAAAIVVVYRTSRVLNFAAGQLATLSAYVTATISVMVGSIVVGWLVSLGVAILMGLVVYVLLMRPTLGQPPFVGIVLTVALAILLHAMLVMLFGADLRFVRVLPTGSWNLFGRALPLAETYSFLLAGGSFAAIYLLYERSRVGIRMRALAENIVLAGQRGINLDRVFATAWAVALLAGAIAGTLYAARGILDTSLTAIGLKGITAALIGGLDSLRGAALGGLIVGAAEYLIAAQVDPRLSGIMPVLLVLVVLVVRPWGLFGTAEEVERV